MQVSVSSMTGKLALVTGGAGGFGSTVAKAFLEDGYEIILTDIDGSRLKSVSQSLNSEGFEANLAHENEVEKMVRDVVSDTGRIDVLFMGHGIVGGRTLLHETCLEDWNAIQAANLTGSFLCMKYVIPIMMKQRSGCIISLTTGDPARKYSAPYISSKLGIEGLTAAISSEVREWNIGVYALSPGGYAATRFHDNSYNLLHFKNYISDEELSKTTRAIKPEVIIPFCRFVAKDESLSLSGIIINALDWNEQNGFSKRDDWYV